MVRSLNKVQLLSDKPGQWALYCFFSAFRCLAMPSRFPMFSNVWDIFQCFPMSGTFTRDSLQVPNLCKEMASNGGETKKSKTATEMEWRAILARRSGLPPFTPGTLGAWGSSQSQAQANRLKGLTSKLLQAPSPNSTFCSISTPRSNLSSKSSSNTQSNSGLSFTKKSLLEEPSRRRKCVVDNISSTASEAKITSTSAPHAKNTSTSAPQSKQRIFGLQSPVSRFQSTANPRPVVHKRERGGAGSSETRFKTFSYHYQGRVDLSTVNTNRPTRMYFLIYPLGMD